MMCKFEQIGKETRIEISPQVSLWGIFNLWMNAYGGWCLSCYFTTLIREFQGHQGDWYLPSLIGSVSCCFVLTIGWFKETPNGRVKHFLRDFFFYIAITALLAGIYCVIFPDPDGAAIGFYPLLVFTVAMMCGIRPVIILPMAGYRDVLLVGPESIDVTRSWLDVWRHHCHFERQHSDVDFEYDFQAQQTSGPSSPKLKSVLLRGSYGALQLGLGETEENLRQIHCILQPLDVAAKGIGQWEFSDPYLRFASKAEVAQA